MKQLFKWMMITCLVLTGAGVHAQENWDVYLASYEKGVGSTVVNMSARNHAPDPAFGFVLITGVTFGDCTPDGFPTEAQFAELYAIADSIKAVLERRGEYINVGTFTYQCERLDYHYVKDTGILRSTLAAMYQKYFPGYVPYINMREDRSWKAYLEFIYPNEETREYMQDQKVVMKLEEAGDKLEKPRRVDHWLYFATEKDRQCFLDGISSMKFTVEEMAREKQGQLPYKLQLSRVDMVDISSISKITLELRRKAKVCNGDYDGWETQVVK
jgi:hypothetical protein